VGDAAKFDVLRWSPVHVPGDAKGLPRYIGIDSETLKNGSSFLWCASDGSSIEEPTAEVLLKFLFRERFKSCVFCTWNLGFERDGLLRLVLPECKPQEVVRFTELGCFSFGDYKFVIAGNKFMRISNGHGRRVLVVDVAPFYGGGLGLAAKKYLGKHKIREDLGIPGENIMVRDWRQHHDAYVKYCTHDAVLTQELAELMHNLVWKDGVKVRSLISPASISEAYYLRRCRGLVTSDYTRERLGLGRAAYQAFWGGNFQLWQRGYVKKVHTYDINSAYPREDCDLPALGCGYWKHVACDDEESGFGFVRMSGFVTIPLLIHKLDVGPLICPVGTFKDKWVTLDEYRYLVARGQDVNVLEAWLFYSEEELYPLREAICEDYAARLVAKYGDGSRGIVKDKERDIVLKNRMNSIGGKWSQRTHTERGWIPGRLFNPMYAAVQNARVRIKLMQAVEGHEDSVIGFATDCVMSSESLELDCPKKKELGKWEHHVWEHGLFLQTGVYNLYSDDFKDMTACERAQLLVFGSLAEDMDIAKIGSRGMARDHEVKIDLLTCIEKNPAATTFLTVRERPYHAREALRSTKRGGLAAVNAFLAQEKRLRLDRELKRVWDRDFCVIGDLLTQRVRSEPIVL